MASGSFISCSWSCWICAMSSRACASCATCSSTGWVAAETTICACWRSISTPWQPRQVPALSQWHSWRRRASSSRWSGERSTGPAIAKKLSRAGSATSASDSEGGLWEREPVVGTSHPVGGAGEVEDDALIRRTAQLEAGGGWAGLTRIEQGELAIGGRLLLGAGDHGDRLRPQDPARRVVQRPAGNQPSVVERNRELQVGGGVRGDDHRAIGTRLGAGEVERDQGAGQEEEPHADGDQEAADWHDAMTAGRRKGSGAPGFPYD